MISLDEDDIKPWINLIAAVYKQAAQDVTAYEARINHNYSSGSTYISKEDYRSAVSFLKTSRAGRLLLALAHERAKNKKPKGFI